MESLFSGFADSVFSTGTNLIQYIAKANGLRLSKKAVLRALYTELTQNIDMLELIDIDQLVNAECDAPLFKTLVEKLETGIICSILYSPKEINRSLYKTLSKMVPLAADEGEKQPKNRTILSAMIYMNNRISLLQKLATLDPQFLNKKLKLQIRLKNILADMKTIKAALFDLDGKIRFLARSR